MKNTKKYNEMPAFEFLFIKQEDSKPFLKRGINISRSLAGKPLSDFISLDPNQFDGELLNENTIPEITKQIYASLINKKAQKFQIDNSPFSLYLYTLCKIDNVIILTVWRFGTRPITQERIEWEKEYKIKPTSCCQQLYCKENNLSLERVTSFSNEFFEKFCHYKKSYIDCDGRFFLHFFNYKNETACDFVENSNFNFIMTTDFTVNSYGRRVFFQYDKKLSPKLLRCTSLDDSIVFDNTVSPPTEHNFQNFLSDALFTCFVYQKRFRNITQSILTQEQRLICISLVLETNVK